MRRSPANWAWNMFSKEAFAKAGNRIRITAQLIGAADGFHLWSERYDRELTDVFAVQDEISASIAAILKSKLMAGPEGGRRYIPNIAAYEAYLKAHHHLWNRTGPESMEKSRACYEQAAKLDPGFALPHAGLAMYYHIASSVSDRSEARHRSRTRGGAKGIGTGSVAARGACLAGHFRHLGRF